MRCRFYRYALIERVSQGDEDRNSGGFAPSQALIACLGLETVSYLFAAFGQD